MLNRIVVFVIRAILVFGAIKILLASDDLLSLVLAILFFIVVVVSLFSDPEPNSNLD